MTSRTSLALRVTPVVIPAGEPEQFRLQEVARQHARWAQGLGPFKRSPLLPSRQIRADGLRTSSGPECICRQTEADLRDEANGLRNKSFVKV